MVFRRRRARPQAEGEVGAEQVEERETGAEPSGPTRTGPWDEADLAEPRRGRIDLGSLLIPAVQGMQIGLERTETHILAVRLQLGESTLRLMPLAAPRTSGIWDEVRAEIGKDVAKNGGTVNEERGPFGMELRATLPTRTRDGKRGTQRMRIIGVDGPRWLLRGDISGRAATDSHQGQMLERIFREVVVVRGREPIPPRDLIPLQLPQGATTGTAAEGSGSDAQQPRQQISDAG